MCAEGIALRLDGELGLLCLATCRGMESKGSAGQTLGHRTDSVKKLHLCRSGYVASRGRDAALRMPIFDRHSTAQVRVSQTML